MMHRIRITQPGWEGYTGNFAGVDFDNGVSTFPVPRNIADRIMANVAAVSVDAEGNEFADGPAERIVHGATIRQVISDELERATAEEIAAEQEKLEKDAKRPGAQDIHTREDLERIAEAEGISGLRLIGDKWDVRHRSIAGLIDEIIKAQEKFVTAKKALEEERRKLSLEAEKESLAAQEAAIVAAARHLDAEPEQPAQIDSEDAKTSTTDEPAQTEDTPVEDAGAVEPGDEIPATEVKG